MADTEVNWYWTYWVGRSGVKKDLRAPDAVWRHPSHKIEVLTRDLRIVKGRPPAFEWSDYGRDCDIVAWRVRNDHPHYEGIIESAALLMYEGEIPNESDGKVEPAASMSDAAAERHPLFATWS